MRRHKIVRPSMVPNQPEMPTRAIVLQPGLLANQRRELFGQSRVRENRNLSHLESGLRNATDNLAELSEAVQETRMMVAESLAGISHLTHQVNAGFNTGQRTSERILHVATQLREEFRLYRTESRSPWQCLWYWWRLVARTTVLLWQLSFSITRNVVSIMPCPLFLCSAGCMVLECAALIFITDIGLMFSTFGISKYFGLSYELFRMFTQLLLIVVPGICGRMINGTLSYFRPYGQIVSEVSGVSIEGFKAWGRNVTSAVSDFLSSAVRQEVADQVEPLVDELRNMPTQILNATSTVVSDALTSVVYDAPKAAINSIFGPGHGEAISHAATSASSIAVGAVGDVIDFGKDAGSTVADYGSVALSTGKSALSTGVEKLDGMRRYGTVMASIGANVASGVASDVSRAASDWWKGKGGLHDPFKDINFLEGRELEEFNKTIGKHLSKLDHMMTKAFLNKYGDDGTIIDKNALEIIVFMEKASGLLVDLVIPGMARMIDNSRAISVEPGLRKVLIQSAFTNGSLNKPRKSKSRRRRYKGRKTRRR